MSTWNDQEDDDVSKDGVQTYAASLEVTDPADGTSVIRHDSGSGEFDRRRES